MVAIFLPLFIFINSTAQNTYAFQANDMVLQNPIIKEHATGDSSITLEKEKSATYQLIFTWNKTNHKFNPHCQFGMYRNYIRALNNESNFSNIKSFEFDISYLHLALGVNYNIIKKNKHTVNINAGLGCNVAYQSKFGAIFKDGHKRISTIFGFTDNKNVFLFNSYDYLYNINRNWHININCKIQIHSQIPAIKFNYSLYRILTGVGLAYSVK